MNEDSELQRPNCNELWDGTECFTCGFTDGLPDGTYETPEGNIVVCTEEEAFSAGYISICPECLYEIITWWEKEDHGMCLSCWHKKHHTQD